MHSRLDIENIIFLGEYSNNPHKLQESIDQCAEYRKPKVLFYYKDTSTDQLFFNTLWPGAKDKIGELEWVPGGSGEKWKALCQLTPFELYSLEKLEERAKQEIDQAVQELQSFLAARQPNLEQDAQDLSSAKNLEGIPPLFTLREELRIKRFFGANMLKDIKNLEKVLSANDPSISTPSREYFEKLILALKNTPSRKASLPLTSVPPQLAAIAAEDLKNCLEIRKENKEDAETYLIRNRLMARILIALGAAVAGAVVGFKAGAVAGGGVTSVPSALIGGCVGGLAGGIFGFFGSANGLGTRMRSRWAGEDYSKAIYAAVEVTGACTTSSAGGAACDDGSLPRRAAGVFRASGTG